MFEAIGKRSFQLLVLILANLLRGPDRDEHMRWCEYKGALADIEELHRPESFTLFEARAPAKSEV